jgi:PAS domain S-box-containing protein
MAPSTKQKTIASFLPKPGLRGRGAVVMVAINGIILTVAAYMLVNMFVTRTIENDRHLLRQEVAQMINDRVAKANADFEMLAMLLSLSNKDGDISAQLIQRARSQEHLPFSLVMWFPNSNMQQYESTIIYPQVLGASLNINDILTEVRAAYGSVSRTRREDTSAVALLVSIPQVVEHLNTPSRILRETYRAVAILRPVTRADGTSGVLMGVLPAQKLFNSAWLSQRDHIERLRLVQDNTQDVIYDVYRVAVVAEPEKNPPFHSENSFQTGLGGWASFLLVQFITSANQQTNMLRMMPVLVVLFGLLITGFGTMYVRNNQRQSLKLAGMNRTLALKNMELNSQVTERERLNQTLRKTERENRAIIDAVSDIIFELDTSGNLLFLNDSWKRLTGYGIDESKGRNLFELMAADDRDEQKAEFDRLVRGQKSAFRFISRLRMADEKLRTVEIGFSMLRMDDAKNLRVVGTITDVEERRRAEAALGEAERKYRGIWENVASGIYQVTPEGQLLTANPALARIFGYDVPGDMVRDVNNMHRQLYASLKDRQGMIRDLMMSGHLKNVEVEGVRKDKTKFWISETSRVVKDEDENVLYFEGSIDDITLRKEAEIKLREAVLESDLANRSKTEFLANMSHELRTPLNAIIGFSEIIKDEVFGKLQQRQYWEYAKDIHDSGRHLLSIINTILDVARIETGERQLNEAMVDVRALTVSVVELVSPKAEINQQPISIIIPDGLPGLVCEELAVKQIMVNLMSNAIKFTPTGGRISISAEVTPGGEMRLAVTDTGVGLDAEEMERVMAPFGHASSHFTRDSSSPGLGLTLVNSLMRLHGGRFEMFSQKGIGTTAAVIFPAVRVRKN